VSLLHRHRYHGCPVCGTMMDRINFAWSGVVVDVCREHGTWFGFGELQRVAEFVGRRPKAWDDPMHPVLSPFTPEGGR
jgi:Zn-finger nucleic acid-binding protein